jgi:hypothetical protein
MRKYPKCHADDSDTAGFRRRCNASLRVLLSAFLVVLLASPSAAQKKFRSDLPADTLAYSLPNMADVTVRHEAYLAVDGEALIMDVFYPPAMAKEEKAPVVIFVAGYSDSSPVTKGPLKEFSYYVSWGRLVAAAGLIAVTYQTERPSDIESLVSYIRKHASELRIDPDRIGLWSCSANCLTAVSFAMQKDLGYLKFAVFYYGIMLSPDNWRRQEIDALCAQRGCYAVELKGIAHIRADLPVFIVKAGRDDVPYVNDSIDHFVGLANKEHALLTLVDFENGKHGFDDEQKSDPKASAIIRETLAFIKKNAAR